MPKLYTEKHPDSWEQLKHWFYALSIGPVFRGQRDATWELNPSLERSIRSTPSKASLELPMVHQFWSRVHHFTDDKESTETFLGKLALMQHHGAPTRLLDWTKSAYVATFFAIEDAMDEKENCAVWALSKNWCNTSSIHIIRKRLKLSKEQLPMETDFSHDQNLVKYIFNLRESMVVAIEPQRLNPRIAAQQGVFVSQGDIYKSFMDNLLALGEDDLPRKLYKFVIPNTWRPKILHDLRAMNIGPDSLLPGLDGFARSIKLNYSRFDDGGAVSMEISKLCMDFGFDIMA